MTQHLPADIDFFSAGRLSEQSDGLQIAICFDYELSRESGELLKLLEIPRRTSELEQLAERRLRTKQPGIARWAGGLGLGHAKQGGPHIPTICLAAATWFPKPWLTISWNERKKLVERFGSVYSSFKPLSISEGYDSPEKASLRLKAIDSDNERGHHFKVYTISLDWTEPATRLKQRFAAWLEANQSPGVAKRSSRGHHKPAEWLWALACYRLAKFPVEQRDLVRAALSLSGSQISRGKKRIEEEMRRRRYV